MSLCVCVWSLVCDVSSFFVKSHVAGELLGVFAESPFVDWESHHIQTCIYLVLCCAHSP
jgi:hypothetical protein